MHLLRLKETNLFIIHLLMEDTNVSLKAVTETLQKELPAIVGEVVNAKMADLETKTLGQIEEVKAELKKHTLAAKATNPELKDMFVKTAIVAITKKVYNENVDGEMAFKAMSESVVKTMSEGWVGVGAELVFDQFEADVLRKLYSFAIPSLVKTTNLIKGDKVILPKSTGGTTTAYRGEGVAATASDVATGNITIDIYQTSTFTSITNELLDDAMTIPDLYDLIVEDVAQSQLRFLEGEILGGSGTSAIQGIINASGIVEIALAATKKVADINDSTIADIIGSLDTAFDTSSSVAFAMSKYTLTALRKLKTTDGYPLYAELRGKNPTLWGYPVIGTTSSILAQSAATDVADKPTIIFGDWSKYRVVRRKGLTIEIGYNNDDFQKGKKSIKSDSRFGGKAEFGEAFVVLSNGPAS